MPYYDYKCQSCGAGFEVHRPAESRLLVRCPRCKGVSERVWSAPNLALYPIKAVRLNGEEIR